MASDGPEILGGMVSRETLVRLEAFVALLRKWQPAENLVSPNALPEVWRRHVADSAQLVALFPDALRWVDLGSGGGFPGMVIACILADKPGAAVHLVESNQRKCAFLRQAVAATHAPARVHHGRIEAVLSNWSAPVEVVTARALAALPALLDMTAPLIAAGAVGLFPKGRDFRAEIAAASQSWDLDLVQHPSRTDSDGAILEVRRAVRRPATGQDR